MQGATRVGESERVNMCIGVESERVVMEGGDAEDSDRRHAVGDACNNGPIRMRCGVIGQYGGD